MFCSLKKLSCYLIFLLLYGAIMVPVIWILEDFIFPQKQPKQISPKGENPLSESAKDDFVSCRLDFQNDFDRLHPERLEPHVPIPASVFTRSGSLYVVLIAKIVDEPTKRQWPLREQKSYLGINKWKIQFGDNVINCSTAHFPIYDDHFLTMVVECPLLSWNSKVTNQRINLTSALHSEFAVAGRNLRICDFELPQPDHQPRYQLAACTQLADDHLDRVPEWIEYHRLIGFQHFIIYVNEKSVNRYQQFLKVYLKNEKIATLVPFYFNITGHKGIFSQQAQQTDCIYRLKGVADWVVLNDVDEFIQTRFGNNGDSKRNQSLLDFLNKQLEINPKIGGVAIRNWFFGFSPQKSENDCLTAAQPNSSYSRIKSMTWASPNATFNERQKTIVRPDSVYYFSVHQIVKGGETVIADERNEARLVHYRLPYLPDFTKAVRSGLITADASLANQFGDAVTERLKMKGFQVSDNFS